jgi:hypothetical protein
MKLKKGGWEHLLGHIRDFLGAGTPGAAEDLRQDIMQSWFEQLGPEIRIGKNSSGD